MTRRTAALLGAALLTLGCPAAVAQQAEPVRTDHHVHVHAPEILAFLKQSATERVGLDDSVAALIEAFGA